MIDRERIAREVAEELGYEISADGDWSQMGRSWLDRPARDALIDARCRIAEVEEIAVRYIHPDLRDSFRLALREKEPKV